MTTLMTWVRGPRSTFKLPIFEETHNRALRDWVRALCITAKFARSCPLWVRSRHRGISNQCPLYRRKRISAVGHVTQSLFAPPCELVSSFSGSKILMLSGRLATDVSSDSRGHLTAAWPSFVHCVAVLHLL